MGSIKDVGDLSGLRDVFAVLVWKEIAFAQEMVVGATCLFAKGTGLSGAAGSCSRLIRGFDAERSAVVSDSGAHDLGIISGAYFVEQGSKGLRYLWLYGGQSP